MEILKNYFFEDDRTWKKNMAEVSRNLRPGPVSCIRMY
jgi:hypothetical protein